MARLNIEDSFWIDIMGVVAKLGDQDKAIGQAIRFMKFAQEKFKNGQEITEDEYKENGFSDVLLGVFAKLDRSKTEADRSIVVAKGADKHFSWLSAKIEAGRRGGLSKSEAKTKHLKQNRTEAKPKQTEAEASKTEPSSSLSPSPSLEKIASSNSILKFENQVEDADNLYSELIPEFKNLAEKLYREFNGTVPRNIKYHFPKLVSHFKKPVAFQTFINEILSNDKKIDSLEAPNKFFTTCILREIGAIQ